MADITIVNGVYKPTNITGGHHPARISRIFMIQVTSLVSLHHPGSTQRLVHLFPRDVSLVLSDGATEGVVALRQPVQAAFVHRPIGLEEDHLFLATRPGKHRKKRWKIGIFNGTTHYKWSFSLAMLLLVQ